LSRRYKSLVAMRLKRQRAIAAPRYSLGGCLTPGRETVEPHTNFSSVEPALIACLRWHGLTREWECARERAARLDLLRLCRVSASICPASTYSTTPYSTTPPAGVQAPRSSTQAAQLHWRRRQLCTPRSNPPIAFHRPVPSPPSSSICRAESETRKAILILRVPPAHLTFTVCLCSLGRDRPREVRLLPGS
jgi:hypothetical protein